LIFLSMEESKEGVPFKISWKVKVV